jgi:hypothetical protein
MSSIVNKIKEAVHTKHSDPEGTHGPHNSKAANAADPRVDSDRDGSRHIGDTTGSHGTYTHSDNYMHGSSHKQGTHLGDGPAPHTAGQHRSDVMNKADPRIDSDRDGSRNMGMSTGPAPYTAGPHRSDAMNKVDPRIDSDRDGSRNMGMNQNTYQHHGISGTGPSAPEGTYGPHSTRVANAMDPRVDSDLDGNKTYAQSNANHSSGLQEKNPMDASQVPPSVMRKHIGEVEIAHQDRTHDRERRNSLATHQENHMMGNVA